MMEEEKWRFLKLLLQRKNVNVSTYIEAIRPLEEKARKCYAEPFGLSANEFVAMMVLDGCFIIELLCKFIKLKCLPNQNDTQENILNDPLFRNKWILNSLQRDLMLFENQLPFFILSELYEMVALPSQQNEFNDLALVFFNDLFPGRGKTHKIGVGVDQDIKHLLDLIHKNWSSQLELNRYANWNMENIYLIRCSTELAEVGIKFEKIEKEVLFDIQFNNGLLQIPVFTIEDRTESFLRNLMAHEQYCGDTRFNIVTDYVAFFSCLIKSATDVRKLSRRGILRNFAGDNEAVCRMFSTMNDFIIRPSGNFHYANTLRRLNIHCERRVNKWMASLRRKYLHSPWGIISILAAFTLLVLTLLQTIFQILSWKKA